MRKSRTILITKAMVDKVKMALPHLKYGTKDYFDCQDFLEVATATEVFYPKEHVEKLSWLLG